MHWIALQAWSEDAQPLREPGLLQALAWQALAFTPRVALAPDAALMEVAASLRLFGGLRLLLQGLDAATRDVVRPGRLHAAPGGSALAALGRLRLGQCWQVAARVAPGALPLAVLDAAQPHLAVLERLGCRQWGDLHRLPREGLARRFGQGLLDALDQALGQQPESQRWVALPEVFEDGVELPFAAEHSTGLLFALQRLLQRLQAWLHARQRGVLALRLVWQHDARRGVAPSGELVLRLGQATQDMAHISRLAAEHLARVQLPAPALALRVQSLETVALDLQSQSLLVKEQRRGEGLAQLVERLGARLGAEAVTGWQVLESHVPERMQVWGAVACDALTPALSQREREKEGRRGRGKEVLPSPSPFWGGLACPELVEGGWGQAVVARDAPTLTLPQRGREKEGQRGRVFDDLLPTWLLSEPLRLRVEGERPCYEGPLTLLVGPQRLETSGWHGLLPGQGLQARASQPPVMRDYFIARSAQAGLLWIFRERLPRQRSGGWYLHGLFA